MRVRKTLALLCMFASVTTTGFGSVASAQEMQTLEPVTIVYTSCYNRTKYVYDGFDAVPVGTERVCDLLLSNGQVITVVGVVQI